MFKSLTKFVFALFILLSVSPAVGQLEDAMNKLVKKSLRDRRERDDKSRLSPLSLTKSRLVRADLELVNDQASRLANIQQDFDRERKLLGESFLATLRSFEETGRQLDDETLSEANRKVQDLKKKTEKQKKEVLLPHQIERLEQIAAQVHIRDAGYGAAIVHPKTAKLLGISDVQKSRIIKRSNEIAEELKKEIDKLKEKARKDLLSELTPKQRKTLKGITGEELELKRHLDKRDRMPQ